MNELERELLRQALQASGLRQKRVAELATVSEPWLSQALNKRRATVDTQMLTRVVNVLSKTLDNLHSAEADVLSKELARLFSPPVEQSTSFISQPGGAVPLNARNYVERAGDKEFGNALKRFVGESTPFTLAVDGPLQCGKTSALGRLASQARSSSIDVVIIDCKDIASLEAVTSGSRRGGASDHGIPRLLAEKIAVAWDFRNADAAAGFEAFNGWMERSLKASPGRKRLLILDALSSVTIPTLRQVLNSLRDFHNNRASQSQVFESLSLVLASSLASPASMSVLQSYISGIQAPEFDFGWFSAPEVGNLLNLLDLEPNQLDDRRKNLIEHCLGQPYLTHLAAVDNLDEAASLEDDIKQISRHHEFAVRKLLAKSPDMASGLLRVCRSGNLSDAELDLDSVQFLMRTLLIEAEQKTAFLASLDQLFEGGAPDASPDRRPPSDPYAVSWVPRLPMYENLARQLDQAER